MLLLLLHQHSGAAVGARTLPSAAANYAPAVTCLPAGLDPTMGEPEQRHGPLPRNSGSTRTVGSVAEELAAAQGSSQVGCWLLW